MEARRLRSIAYDFVCAGWQYVLDNPSIVRNCWAKCGMDMCEENGYRHDFADAQSGFSMPPLTEHLSPAEEEEMLNLQHGGAGQEDEAVSVRSDDSAISIDSSPESDDFEE